MDGTNPNVDITILPPESKRASVNPPTKENPHMTIKLPDYGNIDTLYDLVHEITHTFDVKNFDNTTRWIMGETAPYCVERLLDEFLLGMSQVRLEQNGMNPKTLSKDVLDRVDQFEK